MNSIFHHNLYTLKIIQNEIELYGLVKKLLKSKFRYFDTETSGLRVRYPGNDFVVGWTFAMDDEVDKTVYYIPVAHEFEGEFEELDRFDGFKQADFPYFDVQKLNGNWVNLDHDTVIKALTPVFYSPGTLVAHNIMYDLHVVQNCGIDVERTFRDVTLFDTQVGFHTIDEEAEKKLETILKKRYHVHKVDFKDVIKTVTKAEKKMFDMKANQNACFQHVQIPIGAYYSGEDVWFMKQMLPDVIHDLEEDGQYTLFKKLRMTVLPVLWRMERRGVFVDKKKLAEMTAKAEEELDKIKYAIYEICGIEWNIGSGQQVYEVLHGHKKKLRDKTVEEKCYKESYNEKLVNINFGFPIFNWTDGGKEKDKELKNPKTDSDTLLELLDVEWKQKYGVSRQKFEEGKQVIELLLKYARLEKLYSSFMVGLNREMYQDGKAHPSFNICGTDSWRLSCDHPNLQQLPRPLEKPKPPKDNDPEYQVKYSKYLADKEEYDFWIMFEIRSLFIPDNPDEEVIIAGDWSNLEKRITAHMTKDKNLIRLFEEGLDGHGLVATLVCEECHGMHPNQVKKERPDLRQLAKGIGFAMDYGGTAFAVSRNLKIPKEEAQVYIDKYFEGFEGLATWATTQKQFGRKYGYVLTILGHKRHLKGIRDESMKIKSYYERLCLNSPIQGSAADIALLAQILIEKDPVLRALNCTMRMQVHDELVFVAPKKYKHVCMQRVKHFMEHCLPHDMIVPLISEIDYGDCYAEAK